MESGFERTTWEPLEKELGAKKKSKGHCLGL